jgi:hypothetical protein
MAVIWLLREHFWIMPAVTLKYTIKQRYAGIRSAGQRSQRVTVHTGGAFFIGTCYYMIYGGERHC